MGASETNTLWEKEKEIKLSQRVDDDHKFRWCRLYSLAYVQLGPSKSKYYHILILMRKFITKK